MAPETETEVAPATEPFNAQGMIDYLMAVPDTSTNAATLIVGDTGAGKTHLLVTAAEYNWEVHQRTTRLYMGDLGGLGTKGQSLVRLGILEFWRIRNHNEAFETCELASLGYWPAPGQLDAYTGYAAPDCQLIAPVYSEWSMLCTQGHVVKTVRLKNQIIQTQCPTCKELVGPAQWKIVERTFRSPGFARVGGWMFEGLTSFNDWIMDDMAQRAGRGDLEGEKSALGGKIVSGQFTFGANNRAHYGFAQIRSQNWINNSLKIPGTTMPPIWTALLQRGTDQDRGVPIYGPKIAGNAKTADVPAWVGNCLEAAVDKDEKGADRWTLHLRTYSVPSEGNIPHLCKHRSEPDALPAVLRDQEGQERFTQFSLKYFFQLLNSALAGSIKRDAAKYPNAPALTGQVDETEPVMLTERNTSLQATPAGPARAAATPPRPVMPAGVRAPGAPVAAPAAQAAQSPKPVARRTPAAPKTVAAAPPAAAPIAVPTAPTAAQAPQPVATAPNVQPPPLPAAAVPPAVVTPPRPSVVAAPRPGPGPMRPPQTAQAAPQMAAAAPRPPVQPTPAPAPPVSQQVAPASPSAGPVATRPASAPIRPPVRAAVAPAGRRPIPSTPAPAGGPMAPGTK